MVGIISMVGIFKKANEAGLFSAKQTPPHTPPIFSKKFCENIETKRLRTLN